MTELNDHARRSHALLSASSAHRWLACPPSAQLSGKYPEQTSEFAEEGRLAHEVAEAAVRRRMNGDDLALADLNTPGLTQEMLDNAHAYADYILGIEKDANDRFMLLEAKVDFSPWVPDGFGTADCILITGVTMHVIDYKYGQGVAVSAEDNPQLKLYGLGALHDYGFALCVQRIVLHIFQPRIDNVTSFSLSPAELLGWAETTVAPIARKAMAGAGEMTPGMHCKFCPHAGNCRSLAAACLTSTCRLGDLLDNSHTLSLVDRAVALDRLPEIELWIKRFKDATLAAMLNGDEVPGYKIVEGRGTRAWEDEAQVEATLTAADYPRDRITETKLLSVAQMEKTLGKKKAGELLAGLIVRNPGKPTIAPAGDPRGVYDRITEAKNDFAK